MTQIKINWNRKVTVYGRTQRDTSLADKYFSPAFPKMIDFGNPITDFSPSEFPIEDWKSIPEFESWCELNLPDQNGVFYFAIRATLIQGKHKKKKHQAGRPKYTRAKLLRRGFWKRPRQRRSTITTIVARIEMENGQVIKVTENKSYRRYAPYGQPKYELIKQIEKNASA